MTLMLNIGDVDGGIPGLDTIPMASEAIPR